mgnify:CR=1 FL=1
MNPLQRTRKTRNGGVKQETKEKFANVPVTVIDFDSWDYCVRSEQAKAWGMAFEQYEKRGEND